MNGRVITLLGLAGTLSWNGGPARTSEPPEWALREDLRLGGRRGAGDVVANITQLAVGRDGAIHVLSAGGGITVFDRSGAVVRRVRIPDSVIVAGLRERAESALSQQRDGAAPILDVEPISLWPAMGWLGDTLWVVDRVRHRIELLGTQGNVVGAIPYTPSLGVGRGAAVLAVLADRSLLRGVVMDEGAPRPNYPRSTPPGRYRMPIVPGPPPPQANRQRQGILVRTMPDGTILQGLEILVDSRPSIVVASPYGGARFAYPFQDHPLIGVSPDGREVVVVERYAVARAGPAHYSIARFDIATGKRSPRFHEYTPAPITPGTIDSLLSRLVDSAETGEHRRFAYAFPSPAEAKAAIRAALDAPAFHAPVEEEMVVGTDRTVWLRERGSSRWLAHLPDGRIAGRVAPPPGSRLLYADSATIWAASEAPGGKSGAPILVRYRLVRP
jgi:hypothetical protein